MVCDRWLVVGDHWLAGVVQRQSVGGVGTSAPKEMVIARLSDTWRDKDGNVPCAEYRNLPRTDMATRGNGRKVPCKCDDIAAL